MNIPPVPIDFAEATKKLLSPTCPRFPEASIYAGELATWVSWFADWLGLRLGPLDRLLWAFMSRRFRVEWARTPYVERLLCMGVVGVVPAARAILAARAQRGSEAA